MARHKSAYIVHGIGLSSPAMHTSPRIVDKANGAMAMRGSAPTGVTSADTRRRLIPGMKAKMLMARRGRAERLKEIFSGPSMVFELGLDWFWYWGLMVVGDCAVCSSSSKSTNRGGNWDSGSVRRIFACSNPNALKPSSGVEACRRSHLIDKRRGYEA